MRTLLVIKKRALNLSKFVNVEVYCNASSEFCVLTRALFQQKGISFTEYCIDKDKALEEAMIHRCNNKTIPQIFINNNHIGGYDDLIRLDANYELDKLLGLIRDTVGYDNSDSPRRKTIIVDC
jgi:glutaredoxin 3